MRKEKHTAEQIKLALQYYNVLTAFRSRLAKKNKKSSPASLRATSDYIGEGASYSTLNNYNLMGRKVMEGAGPNDLIKNTGPSLKNLDILLKAYLKLDTEEVEKLMDSEDLIEHKHRLVDIKEESKVEILQDEVQTKTVDLIHSLYTATNELRDTKSSLETQLNECRIERDAALEELKTVKSEARSLIIALKKEAIVFKDTNTTVLFNDLKDRLNL